MSKTIIFLYIAISSSIFSQEIKTPLQKNNYTRITSYNELTDYVKQLEKSSELLSVDVIGKSVQGRNLYALKFSSTEFGRDTSKIKVLLFAQQHGNEQSGKEGVLLLIQELVKAENAYLFDHIDLAIVPQVNPDGSELNQRRNGNDMDLNRNHMIITEPEVIALHNFFDAYQFHVNMDVHEYSPYGESWLEFGYRKNSRELIGCNTNINISEKIRDLSYNSFVPYYNDYLDKKNISNSVYTPGGPPEIDYIRYSTFDVNDGRQSFGIQNTFSFIQEGMNGVDNFKDDLQNRTLGQKEGMMALITFCYQKHSTIKSLVEKERETLISDKNGKLVAIQLEHVQDGTTLTMPVYSYKTGNDSAFVVKDFRPKVISVFDVTKPEGYLIPKELTEIVQWAKRHNFRTTPFMSSKDIVIERYSVGTIDSMDFEGDIIVNPELKAEFLTDAINTEDYLYIPTAQLKGNLLVAGLEPKSELGLVTYETFNKFLKANENYPVLRVLKR